MFSRPGYLLLAVAIAVAPLLSVDARADSDDNDSVRHAVERGEISSLSEILKNVRGKLPGKIAGIEIEREHGRWIYELRVIDEKGRLFDVFVDAKTSKIDTIREK